jgi:hypothetical protein
LSAVEIELIADDQVIEVNHQQRIFLLFGAHALKDILSAEFSFFFTAGGDKANAVLRRDILHALRPVRASRPDLPRYRRSLQRQPAEVGIDIGIAHRRVGIEVRHNNNLLGGVAFMCSNDGAAGHVMPVFRFVA